MTTAMMNQTLPYAGLLRAPRSLGSALGLLLAIGTPLALAGCGGTESMAGPPTMPPMPVQLETVHTAPVEDATEYVGALKSLRSTLVQPQVDGRITRIFVKSGDRVKEGDPIVQIDARRQAAAVSSLEAQQAAREAAVEFARSEVERARQLLEAGAISRQELEQRETALKTAEAALKANGASIQEGQVQLRYFTVTAPTDGIVGDVPVRVGNQVSSQTMLTSLDQNASLEVHVQVPIERAPELRPGLPLRVLGADGSVVAETTVSFVSSRVDDTTQSVLAKGIVANPGSLRAQQFVRAVVVWHTDEGLLIPVLSVTRINDQYFVFVAEEKDGGLVASQQPVRVGQIVGNDYVVRSGLEAGRRIVVSGVQKLANGAPIVPMGETPAPTGAAR